MLLSKQPKQPKFKCLKMTTKRRIKPDLSIRVRLFYECSYCCVVVLRNEKGRLFGVMPVTWMSGLRRKPSAPSSERSSSLALSQTNPALWGFGCVALVYCPPAVSIVKHLVYSKLHVPAQAFTVANKQGRVLSNSYEFHGRVYSTLLPCSGSS